MHDSASMPKFNVSYTLCTSYISIPLPKSAPSTLLSDTVGWAKEILLGITKINRAIIATIICKNIGKNLFFI